MSIDQKNLVQSYDDRGRSTKIVNFITPGAGVLVLGRDHFNPILNKRPMGYIARLRNQFK